MDSNLIRDDIDNFLDKYTRFMTKDIYISGWLYSNFIGQYKYLYDILTKDYTLYTDYNKYKRIVNIITNKDSLIKLHNQKYLQGSIKRYQSFFESFPLDSRLDNRGKMIVLMEEENAYIVGVKNYYALVVGKLKYLISYKNYLESNILVLTSNEDMADNIRGKCYSNNISTNIFSVRDYMKKHFDDSKVLDDNGKYSILIRYITNDLFSNKILFNSFYKAFSKYIYLNKDYREYETFRDYHNYMYKRKYLASKLSLKKFNESEIRKRKTYLRTINNETLRLKEEVDIANFLYLNSVSYSYDSDNLLFRISLMDKDYYIKYVDEIEVLGEKNASLEETIYLYSSYNGNKTYLEVLVYELIKRRCPLEKISDDELYSRLRDTNIDNYFSEFIYKYLIPLIDYYDEYKSLDNVNLSKYALEEFIKIYEFYNAYLMEHEYITNKNLFNRVEEDIINSKYKYLILIGDIPINVNIPTLTIVSNYQETELIKENIKLLYDYKKYVGNNQLIPIRDVYTSKKEISILTKKFLKDNLKIINKSLESTNKNISVYEYDDTNRLHVYRNISNCCFDILSKYDKNSVIGLSSLRDANILIGNDKFTKLDKNTLLTKDKIKVSVKEILKIDKIYDVILLPYLIKDSYHDDLFIDNYWYNLKVMLYVALNKCRRELIILCPSSKREDLDKVLKNIKRV